ncbi:hypothetical protein Ahy_A02g007362 [Arachis hypogaea]|uniref:Uncharacterized protein n=1 Tax=Arachis hypogaea TaxID=3818 RepID=A0A445ECB4_ARAHY|nr:hypothetical protein Ahy_A02g007362 [Arachis hypogaea]
MDRLVTFVYHHMGALKRGVDGKVIYDGDLGYPGYNEVYWLEPGLELGKGLRMLRTDAEVMRMCESAMKNDNIVHLYFDHPIDANPEIIDEEVVSDGSSDSVVEVNPDGDSVKEDEVTNKVDGHANEKENEGVNETSGEVNELEMVLSVAVKDNVNEGVNEATVDVNESNKGESGVGEEAANDGNTKKDTEGASAPEKAAKKVRKRHSRPAPSGLPRERRAAENEVPESNHGEAEAGNEPTEETNADDVAGLNGGSEFREPFMDEERAEEPVTENPTSDNVTQTSGRDNARRNHPRPQPSGQRIVLGKEDEAPRVEVPNPNREDGDSEPEMYQYESEELCSPPATDDEEEPAFPQHNPNTPYGKITLELNMEFETMEQFKAAVQKYNIQIGRQVFYLRNEKKRCRVICYDPDCPWLCYCARTNYPASFQIKTFVDEHTCPRSNKSKSVSCAWRPIGRPTKKRRKDSTEQSSGSQYKAKRSYGQITCQTCKRAGHNSRTCPHKGSGSAAAEPDLDEDEAREQEANWEETMEAAHTAHVADEEELIQNHPQTQPDQNNINDGNTTTNASVPNVATTPAATNPCATTASSEPSPAPKRRGRPSFVRGNPVPPRGRGSTTRRGMAATTTPPTPTQNAAAAPPSPAQPSLVSPDVGSRSQIPASPSNVGPKPQGLLLRPTLQAQPTAPFRPPTVTRETMAAASPATQSRFTSFMPTPSLKKKKPSGPPPSKPSTNDKK